MYISGAVIRARPSQVATWPPTGLNATLAAKSNSATDDSINERLIIMQQWKEIKINNDI